MLFKDNEFAKFSDRLGELIVNYSRNSATAILLIWGVAKSKFYLVNTGKLIALVGSHLHCEDLLRVLNSQDLAELAGCRNDDRYTILGAKFFNYYWSRLPVLVRNNRVIHRGRVCRLSKKELDDISRCCFGKWARSFPELVDRYVFSEDYRRFLGLTPWYVTRTRRDDAVYSMEWLWSSLRELYPEIFADTNAGAFAEQVIEASFPMFWNEFSSSYRIDLGYAAILGAFRGDPDPSEVHPKNIINAQDDAL